LQAWADLFDDLSADDPSVVALERSQQGAGAPSAFVPQTDYGLFITRYGLPEYDPPTPGVLRELIALEGDDGRPPGEASLCM
jgi:hypothetical protein